MAIPRPELGKIPSKKPRLGDDALSELARRAVSTPPAKSETNTNLVNGLPSAPPQRGKIPQRPAQPAAKDDESDLDYLARLRAEQDKVRDATKDDLAAGKAKAQLDAASRAGAAGMGLSGASAALQSDIGRQQDRGAVLALADLDQRQNNEEFDAIGRQGAIMDYEDAYDVDMDGDGIINGVAIDIEAGIGDGDPDNNPEDEDAFQNEDQRKAELATKNAELDSYDHSIGDADTAPGTEEEPFIFSGNIVDLTKYLRENGAGPLEKIEISAGGVPGALGQTMMAFKDKFGNVYILDRG